MIKGGCQRGGVCQTDKKGVLLDVREDLVAQVGGVSIEL